MTATVTGDRHGFLGLLGALLIIDRVVLIDTFTHLKPSLAAAALVPVESGLIGSIACLVSYGWTVLHTQPIPRTVDNRTTLVNINTFRSPK